MDVESVSHKLSEMTDRSMCNSNNWENYQTDSKSIMTKGSSDLMVGLVEPSPTTFTDLKGIQSSC